jgi:hypothetical protein
VTRRIADIKISTQVMLCMVRGRNRLHIMILDSYLDSEEGGVDIR